MQYQVHYPVKYLVYLVDRFNFKVGFKNRNSSCQNLQLAQVDLHYQKRLICTRLKRMTNQSRPMKENVHPRDTHYSSRDPHNYEKRNEQGMNVKKH